LQSARVLLLIPHLGGGGAERVTALLARQLCNQKYEIHLGLVTKAQAPLINLPSSVAVHVLGANRVRSSLPRLLGLVRRVRPAVILSTMAHLNFAVLLLRPFFPPGTRILVRQNGTVSAMLADLRSPALTRALYRILYARADRVLCQSNAMADDLQAEIGISRHRLSVVANPIDISSIRVRCDPPIASTAPHLISVGRLAPEKGNDLLLDAFAAIRSRFPTATLAIAGRGTDGATLKSHATRIGLNGSVRFLGHIDDPAELYSAASAFVLPSRHEGLPNALLEAAAAGLPLIATPASGGVIDLMRGQPGTWLADAISADALAQAITAALQTLAPGDRFAHPWIDAFGLDRAIAAYESAIDAMLEQGRA
jgi:glycosyltransferase involved in cell wall biosynthesis